MNDTVIVVGVDGTVGGIRALRWAITDATQRRALLKVVTAWQFEYGSELGVLDRDSAHNRAMELVRDALAVATHERLDSILIESVVREGPPVPVLIAESANAALLVLGHRGRRRRLLDALLGSISAECIRHARCPVVVVPPARPAVQAAAARRGAPPPRGQ